MRVVLVGFPGCGKSSAGKKLAAKLGYDFVDLDDAFEETYHVSIPNFFVKYSEPAFRSCERKVLLDKLQHDNVVISSGGGTPCFADNMDTMKKSGIVVYIKMAAASLFDRLIHAKRPRPLVQNKSPEELQEFIAVNLPKRETFYQQAHLTVKGESIDIEGMSQEIRKFAENCVPLQLQK
ncbi:MAG: shikimate kinase [Bacteroidales bacterium]|nr:shikimate kinase [Bacteroidales bacterium]